MDMLASRLTRFSLVLTLLGGCFSEVGSTPTPSDTDPTTPQMCTAGALGCVCYGNGSCDAELECAASIDMCVPADCEPRSHHCVCDAGNCRDALMCIDGLCLEPGDDATAGDATVGSSPASTTVTDATADESTSQGASASASGWGESTDGTTSESTTETVPPDCEALSCGECVSCVAQPDAPCAEEAVACEAVQGCMNAAGCLVSCAVDGFCLDACCEGLSSAIVAAAATLNICRGDACIDQCDNDYLLMDCP